MQNPEIQFRKFAPDYTGLKVEEVAFGTVVDFYGKEQEYKMDVIVSEEADLTASLPCVVFIHGGGFVQPCDKRQAYIPIFAKSLCKAGYVVVSPDYPIFDTGEDREASGLDRGDFGRKAAEAMVVMHDYLMKNAERFHIDMDRMAIMGGSAGGMTSFATIPVQTGVYKAFVNCWGVPAKALLPDVSVFPPTLSIHGTADQAVPYENEKPLQDALEEAGIDHRLITLEGCPHTPLMKYDVFGPEVVAWVDRYVK